MLVECTVSVFGFQAYKSGFGIWVQDLGLGGLGSGNQGSGSEFRVQG